MTEGIGEPSATQLRLWAGPTPETSLNPQAFFPPVSSQSLHKNHNSASLDSPPPCGGPDRRCEGSVPCFPPGYRREHDQELPHRAQESLCELGERDPARITSTEAAEWVAALAGSYRPGNVQLYLIAFRLLLDYVGLEENPARDPRVKLPKRTRGTATAKRRATDVDPRGDGEEVSAPVS
jgi:hypothetical protein